MNTEKRYFHIGYQILGDHVVSLILAKQPGDRVTLWGIPIDSDLGLYERPHVYKNLARDDLLRQFARVYRDVDLTQSRPLAEVLGGLS